MQFYTYDLETLKNYFSFCGKWMGSDEVDYFEMSTRIDQRAELLQHLNYIQSTGAYMVGYNSNGFDYPVLHQLLLNPYTFTYKTAREICEKIIGGQKNYGQAGPFTVWAKDRIISQLDVMKMNHFDNAAKRTSLKALQFAMRSHSIQDLPFPHDHICTPEDMDEMKVYNIHDVTETEKFLGYCMPLVEMRQELKDNQTVYGDVMNYSDVKIGEQLFIKRLGRSKCFVGSKPKQTARHLMNLETMILPKIEFITEPFQEVLDWFKGQTIDGTSDKDSIKLERELGGVPFNFGKGGVHASVTAQKFESNDEWVIKDVDVAGMYPAVAIANGFYPEHLGEEFCHVYKQLQQDRKQYPKGTTMNAVLKLAGNGVYGNSNNKYSCFYDPKYTFSVTVNGQLQLCQLAERLSLIPSLKIIQANTDGVTVYLRKSDLHFFNLWCSYWESITGLTLEEVEYSRMWIQNVNNYMAETVDGKIKRKGAYWYPESIKEYEGWWNKDFSMLAVQKGVDLCHRFGWKPEDVIHMMSDPFDFMLRYKTPSGSKLYIGDKEMQKTTRYYVSTKGEPMFKVSPPKGIPGHYKRKNKISDDYYASVLAEIGGGEVWDARVHTKNESVYEERRIGVRSGKLVRECNVADRFDWNDLDYQFYIDEIKKLIIGDENV